MFVHKLLNYIDSSLAWSFSSVILITAYFIYKDNTKRKLFMNMISNKFFVISSLLSFIFSIYIYSLSDASDDTKNLQSATKDAIIAYIIAILASLDLRVTPFWFIWMITYYLGK